MRQPRRSRLQNLAAASLMGTCLLWWPGGCDFGSITTTSTVTLDGRTVISSLIKSGILTPLETWINTGVDALFDKLENND